MRTPLAIKKKIIIKKKKVRIVQFIFFSERIGAFCVNGLHLFSKAKHTSFLCCPPGLVNYSVLSLETEASWLDCMCLS